MKFRAAFIVLILIALVAVTVPLAAQEDVDDLFSIPDETVDEDQQAESDAETDDAVDIAALTMRDGPQIAGTFSATAAVSGGLVDWTSADFGVSAYALMDTGLSLDIRPSSYFRFFTSVSTSLNSEDLDLPMFDIGELFVDYTLADAVFFRLGRQSLSWGQGINELLGNPGNVLEDFGGSTALKAFLPLGTNGLTLLGYGNPAWYNGEISSLTPGADTLAYASLYEHSVGSVTLGVSGKYRHDTVASAEAYVKTVLSGADLVIEGRVDSNDGFSADPLGYDYLALTGLFWENSSVQLLAEYLFDASVTDGALVRSYDHRFALGLLSSTRFAGWRPGIRWFHAAEAGFTRHSGQLVLGASRGIAPRLTINIGLPISYGNESGYYMQNSDDPSGRVASLVISLTLEEDL
jgi:hypothetical protein